MKGPGGAASAPVWGLLVLLGLILGGCLPPAAQDPPGQWDRDCRPQDLYDPQLPLLRSLYTPEHWARRQAARSRLHVPVPMIDMYALGQAVNPDLAAVPRALPDPLPTYNEGELQAFRVLDADGQDSWELEARLVFKSATSYAWVEAETGADEDYVRRLVADFDRDVYPATLAYFGPVLPVGFDRDPRIHMLFVRNLGNVLGYFSSLHAVSRQVHPLSNEKDMLFLNLDYIGDREADLGVLAHEFEHLIHWHHAPGERSFLDEGLAELAAVRWQPLQKNDARLGGYDRYRHEPALQLNAWFTDDYTTVERHYGSGLGFAVYLTELFGPEFARELAAEPRRGIAGLESLLQARGCAFTFDDLFADFALANLVWDPWLTGLAGPLGPATLTPWLPPVDPAQLTQTPLAARETVTGSLPPYAVHYLSAAPDALPAAARIVFEGEPAVSLIPEAEIPGTMLWSNRHNEGRAHVSRAFDLTGLDPGQPVFLDTRMWWDIEENWDFGYVLASRNGQDWVMLSSTATVPPDRHGRSRGPALTGRNPPDDGVWSRVRWDLSPYAGDEVWIRFDYVTDSAITGTGWVLDEVAIDAIGYREGFDGALGDWDVAGWVQTANAVPVDWLVQVAVLNRKRWEVRTLERRLADAAGQAAWTVPGLAQDERLYLLVSPLAPAVTGAAAYELRLAHGAPEAARIPPAAD